MVIKIRQIRGPRKRGEKLTFATIPLREASRINPQTLRKNFEPYYGAKADYHFLAEQIRDFSVQDSRERVIPMLELTKKRKNYPEETKYLGHYLTLKRVGKTGGTIAIVPSPVVHDVLSHGSFGSKGSTFEAVLSILDGGFEGGYEKDDNAVIKRKREHRTNDWPDMTGWKKGITQGDLYSFELFPEEGEVSYSNTGRDHELRGHHGYSWRKEYKIGEGKNEVIFNYGVHRASPKRIMSLNIRLSSKVSDKEKLRKMKFYKEQISDKYNIPIRFYETRIETIEETTPDGKKYKIEYTGVRGRRLFPRTLEGKVGGITAIIGLLGSIIFLSANLTGNAISNLSLKTSNMIGVVLFLVGIMGAFFYFKKRKTKEL